MKPEIEEFARLLVRHVRDAAIQGADLGLRPDSRGPSAVRWRAAGVEHADVVIPDVVDATLFYLLHAIDEGLIRIEFVSPGGTHVDLTEEGLSELGGWYMGTWRLEHTKERCVDDYADIEAKFGRT